MKMKVLAVLLLVLPAILSERIQLIGITPEEAQGYIAQQSLDLKYAKKLNEAPLPVTKSEDGKESYYKGRLIDNPDDYVEETYEASQFHGQDGLGKALFGYTDYNQARVEERKTNGNVKGSYQFIDPNGENIIVNYWSDGRGFHQTDNRPEVVLEPATDTPENVAARIEHERAWNEIANANNPNQNPMRAPNAFDRKQPDQGLTRNPTNTRAAHEGAESQLNENKLKPGQYDPENEVTSEPKGFFYSFEYPVDLLADNPSKRS